MTAYPGYPGYYHTRRAEMVYPSYLDTVVVSPPPAGVAGEMPVTRDQLKLQARVDNDFEDELLDIYVAAAVAGVEHHTGRKLAQVAIDAYIDRFPWGPAPIALPWGRVTSVSEIQYREEDDAEVSTTWPAAQYALDRFAEGSSIRPIAGERYPGAFGYRYGRDRQAVRIRYVAGYPSADDVPVALKQACLMLAAELYIEREAHRTMPGVLAVQNPAVKMLLSAYKIWWPA